MVRIGPVAWGGDDGAAAEPQPAVIPTAQATAIHFAMRACKRQLTAAGCVVRRLAVFAAK